MAGIDIPFRAPGASAAELSPLQYAKPPRLSAKSEAEALKVGKDFEAMFLSQMLTPIFDQLETDGPFGGGNAEKIFRSYQVDQYGKAIAQAGGIGLADAIKREILRMQEKQP